MKTYLVAALSALTLGACALAPTTTSGPAPTAAQQLASAQLARNAACQIWSTTFQAALAARQAGIASPTLIQQINIGDAQFTPVCTSPLPTDLPTLQQQTIQVMASVGTMELLLKEMKK